MEAHDLHCMALALAEAEKGKGRTSPNPAVGAVIVREGVVVGRGYHRKAGTPHAEVNAIADAGIASRGATLYVTLEPCNHTGRTPPCTEAILAAGIARVVIGMADPNPEVAGGGAAFLTEQGIEVCSGVLEEQCRRLNRPFIKRVTTGRPWVIMKAGLSLDGRISLRPGEGVPLTGPATAERVHCLRNEVDGILIGIGTALSDNPSLTTRLKGVADTRDPLRIILDSRLRLPAESQMLHQGSAAETWIFCAISASEEREEHLTRCGAKIIRVATGKDGHLDLDEVLGVLAQGGVTSLLVEGGGAIHGAFWRHQLVDEVVLYYAPFFIGDGGMPLMSGFSLGNRANAVSLTEIAVRQLGQDILVNGLVDPASRASG